MHGNSIRLDTTGWARWSTAIVQEIEIWPYEQMVYVQTSICPGKWDAQTPLGFWNINRSPNLGQTTRPSNNQQEKENWTVDFAVPADHRIKLKESEKRDKYLNLARKLKKLWNMKVTVIPIVIGTLGTVTKGLLQGLEDLEIRGQVETFQTIALLRSSRILRRVLETLRDLCRSNSSEKPPTNTDVKNSKRSYNNSINRYLQDN